MATRINIAPGEFYHIYNRGTEKRTIFLTPADYARFLSLLYICNGSISTDLKLQGSTLEEILRVERGQTLVDICAYVLMPNHFHFLLREKDGGGISKFMQKLTTGYTMYFNKKNERTGSLLQGRFKAKHIADGRYLSYLLAYIHLNPVKLIEPNWKETGIADRSAAAQYLKEYPYSSYPDYTGADRAAKSMLCMSAYPTEFETPADFETSVSEWLQGSTL